MADEKKKALPNVRALKAFRLGGEHVKAGAVLPKAAFPKTSDWQNLCHMDPARAEETGDAVAAAPADEKGAAKKGGMPAAG
jgi:hypothetical protein